MSELEISPTFGKRIKLATWCAVVMGVLLFYVFGYFPLVTWVAVNTSLLDNPNDWVISFLNSSSVPLKWLCEIFPSLESYYDQFAPKK